jgi:hypothetical protein
MNCRSAQAGQRIARPPNNKRSLRKFMRDDPVRMMLAAQFPHFAMRNATGWK